MRVMNQGDWAKDALQIEFKDQHDYQAWRDSLQIDGKSKVLTIGESNGSMIRTTYLIVEGHRVMTHVPLDQYEQGKSIA